MSPLFSSASPLCVVVVVNVWRVWTRRRVETSHGSTTEIDLNPETELPFLMLMYIFLYYCWYCCTLINQAMVTWRAFMYVSQIQGVFGCVRGVKFIFTSSFLFRSKIMLLPGRVGPHHWNNNPVALHQTTGSCSYSTVYLLSSTTAVVYYCKNAKNILFTRWYRQLFGGHYAPCSNYFHKLIFILTV